MGKVSTGFSMSLDGFVAGPNDDTQHVFAWMTRGDTDDTLTTGETAFELKIAAESVAMLEDARNTIGAVVAGRQLYELTQGWGGHHPIGAPVVVVTHRPPPEWVQEHWPVAFVTDGVASALERAKGIAGSPARKRWRLPPRRWCSSARARDCLTKSTSTWSPSCWVTVSACSSTSRPPPWNWKARKWERAVGLPISPTASKSKASRAGDAVFLHEAHLRSLLRKEVSLCCNCSFLPGSWQ